MIRGTGEKLLAESVTTRRRCRKVSRRLIAHHLSMSAKGNQPSRRLTPTREVVQ